LKNQIFQIQTPFRLWQPDKDANQMLMVCDWLKKQIHEKNAVKTLVGSALEAYAYFDEDIFEKVKEAFMEFNNQ